MHQLHTPCKAIMVQQFACCTYRGLITNDMLSTSLWHEVHYNVQLTKINACDVKNTDVAKSTNDTDKESKRCPASD